MEKTQGAVVSGKRCLAVVPPKPESVLKEEREADEEARLWCIERDMELGFTRSEVEAAIEGMDAIMADYLNRRALRNRLQIGCVLLPGE